ncbi:MAG: APC family permease [Sarcina sp.]
MSFFNNYIKNPLLTLFGFFAITLTLSINITEYPTFASFGFKSISFIIATAILWLFPVTFCSCEMATIKNFEEAGTYTWISKIFNNHLAFICISLQWIKTMISFIPMLYLIISGLSYIFDLSILNENLLIKILLLSLIFGLLSFLQFEGAKITELISKIGVILGIFFPSLILIIFTLAFLLLKKDFLSPISFDINDLIPHINNFASYSPFILSYMGIDGSAVHFSKLRNRTINYPKAVIYSSITIITIDILVTLSIIVTITNENISLTLGLIQSFNKIFYFTKSKDFILKALTLCLIIGVSSKISAWIITPVQGIFNSTKPLDIKSNLKKLNKFKVPTNLIFLQWLLVTIVGTILTLLEPVKELAFSTALSLATILSLISYIIFFLTYIIKVSKRTSIESHFNISNKKIIKLLVSSIGLLSSTIIFLLTLKAPAKYSFKESIIYSLTLLIFLLIFIIIPSKIYKYLN